jgi:hypothetical protein
MVLVGRPDSKKLFGRSRRGWEDNIKIELKKSVRALNWIDLAQDEER